MTYRADSGDLSLLSTPESRADHIEQRDGKWVLLSKKTGEVLGTHPSREEAVKQEQAIEASKHRKDAVDRIDVLRLDGSRAERTPQGGLRVPANLTRTGVFQYRNADGSTRREYRPPSEVFNADSLGSLEDAPVTDLHQGMVRADTFQALSKGHARGIKRDGQFVAGTVLVQDAALVAAVEARSRTEISCGYQCKLDMTPGTSPEGETYDAIQTDIRYNHVALLPAGTGRAGREVALRLDGASYVVLDDMQQPCQNRGTMIVHFDGKDYDLAKPAEKASYDAAVVAQSGRLDSLTAELATAKTSLVKVEAERDQANKDRDAARADATDARDPAKLSARVKERSALEAKATGILGADAKLDGLTDEEIREKCVLKSDPSAKDRLDSYADKSARAVYATARFDAINTDSSGSVRAAIVASTLPGGHNSQIAAPAPEAWTSKLAMSKDN